MKILYVTTVSLTLNTFLIPHVRYLIENGYQVDIASNIDVPISEEYEKMNVKHIKIDYSRNPIHPINIKAFKQIKELQKNEGYDIVHVHTPVASFVTRLALKNENIKMIYTAHGFHFYTGAPWINWMVYYPLEKIAARWTDTLVTINSEDLKRAKKFNLRNNGNVELMHGVGINPEDYKLENFDREEYRKSLGLNEDDFAILILAELNKNKNHMQIIKAMEQLKDRYPNINLLCAGKGPLDKELKEKVKELALENNIAFLGFRKDVKELLHSCDCVSLMSVREGLGKCLIEAMITERPMLATDTRGPKELIKNNENGFLVEVEDVNSTIKYIEKLYNDKSIREEFIEKSKKKVSKYYMGNVLSEIREVIYEI